MSGNRKKRPAAAAHHHQARGERGALSLAELARNIGLTEAKTRRLLADFEAVGIAERVGENWRLTDAAAAEYCLPFEEIREGNAPLEEGDDDGRNHCPPGPPPAAADRAA